MQTLQFKDDHGKLHEVEGRPEALEALSLKLSNWHKKPRIKINEEGQLVLDFGKGGPVWRG